MSKDSEPFTDVKATYKLTDLYLNLPAVYFSCILTTDSRISKRTNKQAGMLTHTQIIKGTEKQMYLSLCPGHPKQGNLPPKCSLKNLQVHLVLTAPILPWKWKKLHKFHLHLICQGWMRGKRRCSSSTRCDIQPHFGLSLQSWCNSISPLNYVLSVACLVHKRSMTGSRIIHFFFHEQVQNIMSLIFKI